jgi:hypothetical protein
MNRFKQFRRILSGGKTGSATGIADERIELAYLDLPDILPPEVEVKYSRFPESVTVKGYPYAPRFR